MVLRIRVRFGKREIAAAAECKQPPTTKPKIITPVHRHHQKDCGQQNQIIVKAEKTKKKKAKKMQKQPLIAAAAGQIKKPIKLRIFVTSEDRRRFFESKKATAAVQQPPPPQPQPPWPIWALSEGQMSDSFTDLFYEGGGGGESVSVNQPWRPTYFDYPEVNNYSGFRGGRGGTEVVRRGSRYNPIVISGDESDDRDDTESVGENDPVDDWSNDGEVESRPRDLDRLGFEDEDDRMSRCRPIVFLD